MRELPQLNEALCTHCSDCVAICPPQCLALAPERPWLIRPRDCTSCSACVLVCPTQSITMQPLPTA